MTRKPRWVYFAKPVGMRGPIKIGCTTDIGKRLDDLMRWSPIDLELLATTPGDFNLEARIQRMFYDQHSRHEWFDPSPALNALIDTIRDGTFDQTSVPQDARPLWLEHHRACRWPSKPA